MVFGVIALPVFAWAIVNMLRELPAWLLRLNTWDLVGVIAYTQAFALAETLLVWMAIIALAILLPGRLLRDRFVTVGAWLVTLAALWAMAYHLSPVDVTDMGRGWLAVIGVAALASAAVTYAAVTRSSRLAHFLRSAAERISILSFAYAGLGVLGVVLILVRNL